MNLKIFIPLFICFAVVSCTQKSNEQIVLGKRVKESTKQVLLVYNETPEESKAILLAFEKTEKGWQQSFDPIPAGIGRNGFAAEGEKREGDGKSPSGLFDLGQLFTYEKVVNTKMPFTQSTTDDKWIDDPESPDYNKHIRGETDAKSFENLLLESDYYKYCIVIEYNTNPIEKGKGSAIFFHLNGKKYESTAGCVAISEKDMLAVLKWLDPVKNPMILMGSKEGMLSELY